MLTSATTWKHKQINTPLTTHPNQFQLFHDSIHSFLYFPFYPFTGTTYGCGNSHKMLYNVSVKLQMSNDRIQL
jgi:acetoin utilization deacetylase AcuC-like enzyme